MNKEQILKHIQAARLWLDKAQDFVEKNNVIRGLSFLFLASAETQMPLRESQKVEKKAPDRKAVFRMNPAYSAALAASVTFIISFVGWKVLMKSSQQVTAKRVSASEFVARMKASNEIESVKASSMLEDTLRALQKQMEEPKTVKKSTRWVAFHSPKKTRPSRRHVTSAPQTAKTKNTYSDQSIEKAAEKRDASIMDEKIISSAETENDLIGLVKIGEKTLKGQN